LTVQPPVLGDAVGTARYEIKNPAAPDLPGVDARAAYNLQPIQPPVLGDAVGTARYEIKNPAAPDLPGVDARAAYNLQPVQPPASSAPQAKGINISFSPTINLPPGSADQPSALESGLRASETRLREMLAKILGDDRRLSYV
jgi:hypothetical protein